MLLLGVGLGLLINLVIINGVCYLGLTPSPQRTPLGKGAHQWAGVWQSLAYGVTVLRLPFGLAPYLLKVGAYLIFGERLWTLWSSPLGQIARGLGDLLNFVLASYVLSPLISDASIWSALLIQLCLSSELARLILEKGQMGVSLVWQFLPHRAIANQLRGGRWAQTYCAYYGLNEAARLAYLLTVLRVWSHTDAELAEKLRYVRGFQIVPNAHPLRTGQVRDVARGQIYLHTRWSNDPWLLIGQALRRSPWLFDPRYLPRPFYYRTEANPRATLFVLSMAHYCPPFALYQLGHEIKAARFELFGRCGRWLGWEWEQPVQADGAYAFDPALRWLGERLGYFCPTPPRPLWSEAEALAEIKRDPTLSTAPIEILAQRFTFPLSYVEEVLLPRARQAASQASATLSGDSQCG